METIKPLTRLLRIHGDNIIECERTLNLIATALGASTSRIYSPLYMPIFTIERNGLELLQVQLLPGYKRWNINILEELRPYGALLREAPDAIVTELIPFTTTEQILFATEYSSALSAGNQAWQRSGRALVCAAGVPYLYFAEFGGVELDENRDIIAPRFPNPIVPFSYLAANKAFDVLCLPVYLPSPSISESLRTKFNDTFGEVEGQQLVRFILEGTSHTPIISQLADKAMKMVENLSGQRTKRDTLRGQEWHDYFNQDTAEQKVAWLQRHSMPWTRKKGGKVSVTATFRQLPHIFQAAGCLSIGAKDIPICLAPSQIRIFLAQKIKELYQSQVSPEFLSWLASTSRPLIVVWITGFKPKGEDSRPDRGLIPLARMLFGDEVDVLAIVSGPAKPQMWQALQNTPQNQAKENGLWEAVFNLSDGLLVDSTTAVAGPFALLLPRPPASFLQLMQLPAATAITTFSEHDVDTILHTVFTHSANSDVFEAICNPPGGDWSGLSLIDFSTRQEFRWTSLPRVSGSNKKRPDHVIESLIDNEIYILSIESKNLPKILEANIGDQLNSYTRELVINLPISARVIQSQWNLGGITNLPMANFQFISGGACCWTNEDSLKKAFNKAAVDIIFGVEISTTDPVVVLHIITRQLAQVLLNKLSEIIQNFKGQVKIQIH